MSQDEELDNTATYYCNEDEGHQWVYIHEPRSIPTDYKKCDFCDVLDASEAIATLIREARIDELNNFAEDDDGGYYLKVNGNNIRDRITELTNQQKGEQ